MFSVILCAFLFSRCILIVQCGNRPRGCSLENDPNCCPCFPEKSIQESFDQLILISSEPELVKPVICRKAARYMRMLNNYTNNCDSYEINEMFNVSSAGFRENWKSFCSGNAQVPKCDKIPEAVAAMRGCIDRSVNSAYFILKNIPQKDELSLYCCTIPKRIDCMYYEAKNNCGKMFANFFAQYLNFARKLYVQRYCTDAEDTCSNYPDDLKEIDSIMENSITSGRSLAYAVYKIHLDSIESACYNYD